jgi:hypothetical protein
MQTRTRSARSAALIAASFLALAACGGGGDDDEAAEETTTTEVEETTTTEVEETTTTEATEPADDEIPGGVEVLGAKSILLDGFFGVEIPDGWSITSAEVPTPSSSPAGGETELDPDALVQALVVNPDAAPTDATFSLVHYQHSDSVPDLAAFDEAIVGLLSGDGSTITEGQASSIGGQESILHQVRSAQGQTGLLVSIVTGGEYFFIVSLIGDPSYSTDTANMLTTSSFVPEVLFG